MKHLVLMGWIISWGLYLSAQELTLKRSVIANGGRTESISDLSISFTVGEPIVGAERNGVFLIHQGFQQALEGMITSLTPSIVEAHISVYPNPTRKELYIDVLTHSPISLKVGIYDLQARVVLEKEVPHSLDEHHIELNLERLSSGMYHMLLSDFDNKLIDHLPFQKIP